MVPLNKNNNNEIDVQFFYIKKYARKFDIYLIFFKFKCVKCEVPS
jgi:hypothetical protein